MGERYYSQHGEDFILRKIFPKDNGFFVEVGCIDGLRFSNTLFFEKKGWKGICIEAHSSYIDLMKENRPNSQIVHCAIGEKDEGVVTFYANARGSLSSLDKSTEKIFEKTHKQFFSGFEEQKVEKRTLTSVFDQLGVGHIDFISIDIEGYEVEAMEGLDLNKYKPTLFLVEVNSMEHKLRMEKMLLPAGYKLILNFGGNLYYSLDPSHEQLVSDKRFDNVFIEHTKHPLDEAGKEFVINIDTTKKETIRNSSSGFMSSIRKIFGGK